MSRSISPTAAVTVPGSALEAARRGAELAVALNSRGSAAPRLGAVSAVVARNVAPGRWASATEWRTIAVALGASAGPAGTCCVDLARLAEPEVTIAGLDSAGNALSRFGDWPTPAEPARDRRSTIRAGAAASSRPGVVSAIADGISTARPVRTVLPRVALSTFDAAATLGSGVGREPLESARCNSSALLADAV